MNQSESLILEHQDYVPALARKIAYKLPRQVDFEELVAFGQLGLVEAANRFDPSHGVTFKTFSYYRIRGAIFDGVRKMTWLPPAVRREVEIDHSQNEVIKTTADAPDSDDPEVLAKRFSDAVARLGVVGLLDDFQEHEQPPVEHATPADTAEKSELIDRLREAMTRLPEDQAVIIRMMYVEHQSMTDIGRALGKNKSTISRRHVAAIDAMRVAMMSRVKLDRG